jgi:hypothetical protein
LWLGIGIPRSRERQQRDQDGRFYSPHIHR